MDSNEPSGLTEFRLTNFKSYQEATLRLSPLTLLIGPNASGKSNLLEGIRLLSWMARDKRLDEFPRAVQDNALAVRGALTDLTYGRETEFHLGYSIRAKPWNRLDVGVRVDDAGLRIYDESVTGQTEQVPLYHVADEADGYSHDVQVSYNNFLRGGWKPKILCTDQQLILTQLGTPARFAEDHKRSQETIPQVANLFRGALIRIILLDPAPRLMRSYSHVVDRVIRESGSNLSSVLYELVGEGHKARILEFIKALPEQDITGLGFVETPRNEVMVKLTETFAGKAEERDATVLSDGTLRVLAIAAVLLYADEGSLVVIEEIDSGVHPSRVETLLRNIFEISEEKNLSVLLTSHNPALLNALPVKAIPKVACCYRDLNGGDSRITHIEDLSCSPELLAQGPLGTLMTSGVLDRYLKEPRDPEEKAAAALKWLETMEAVGE